MIKEYKDLIILSEEAKRRKCLLQSISADNLPSCLWKKKKHTRLTFHLVPFFRSQNHPFGCIIAQDERKKNGQDYATNEPSDCRQERINYCPLTVSFPAPELSVSPPGGIGSNIQFHASPLHQWFLHRHPYQHQWTIIILWLSLEFRDRLAGKTTVELSEINCQNFDRHGCF